MASVLTEKTERSRTTQAETIQNDVTKLQTLNDHATVRLYVDVQGRSFVGAVRLLDGPGARDRRTCIPPGDTTAAQP